MKRTIQLDGQPCSYDDGLPAAAKPPAAPVPGPLDAFYQAMVDDAAWLMDALCSIPPLSWLDAALNAFVGPSK